MTHFLLSFSSVKYFFLCYAVIFVIWTEVSDLCASLHFTSSTSGRLQCFVVLETVFVTSTCVCMAFPVSVTALWAGHQRCTSSYHKIIIIIIIKKDLTERQVSCKTLSIFPSVSVELLYLNLNADADALEDECVNASDLPVSVWASYWKINTRRACKCRRKANITFTCTSSAAQRELWTWQPEEKQETQKLISVFFLSLLDHDHDDLTSFRPQPGRKGGNLQSKP